MKGLEQETQPFVDFSAEPLEIHLGPHKLAESSFNIKHAILRNPVPILEVIDGCQHRIPEEESSPTLAFALPPFKIIPAFLRRRQAEGLSR